jgi:hypothetical protein
MVQWPRRLDRVKIDDWAGDTVASGTDVVGDDDSGRARTSDWFHSNQLVTRNLKVAAPLRLGHRSLVNGEAETAVRAGEWCGGAT